MRVSRTSLLVAFALCACSSHAAEVVDSSVTDGKSDVADAPQGHDTRDSGTLVDAPAFTGPKTLAETGLYSDFASRTLAEGVIAYDVRYPLWSDGAGKNRHLLLPKGTQIDTHDLDDWRFPVGTKLWKEFEQGGVLLETRYLEKKSAAPGADSWLMVSYAWNADHSAALAVPSGVTGALGTSWDIPDQDACVQCHEGVIDTVIGVSAMQLGRASGKGPLSDLVARGLLSDPPSAEPQPPGTGVVQDALGYLHGNCGHCHNDTSPLAGVRKMRLRLRVADTTPESTPTYTTAIDAPMTHQWDGGANLGIVRGDPDHSQVFYRMSHRGDGYEMPPVGSKVVDASAAEVIRAWITGLAP